MSRTDAFRRPAARSDEVVNDGQLCLRGRFCMTEVTHHYSRGKQPKMLMGEYFRKVKWEEAVEKATGAFSNCSPDEVVTLVSPDLTNESIFAAQKFVRECLKSENIDSTARERLAGGPAAWAELFSHRNSIHDIRNSDVVLAVSLDTRFDFSVTGVEVRHALADGATLITVDSRDTNLARYTDDWLQCPPGTEGALLKAVITADIREIAKAAKLSGLSEEFIARCANDFAHHESASVILGPSFFTNCGDVSDALKVLGSHDELNVIPLYWGANTRGALELGAMSGVKPGPRIDRNTTGLLEKLRSGELKPKVLYLIGDVPFSERPEAEFVICQDIYEPPFPVDVYLPAASFAEAEGTLTNVEGRVQHLHQVEFPPDGARTGFVRPDWKILSMLATAMEADGFAYESAKDLRKDIAGAVEGFPAEVDRERRRVKPGIGDLGSYEYSKPADGEYKLLIHPGGYVHRGVGMQEKVSGLKQLSLESGVAMNPQDMKTLNIQDGERVDISASGLGKALQAVVRAREEVCPGTVTAFRPTTGNTSDMPLYGPLNIEHIRPKA
ncbi:MAG: molybdopterin-dependent oxidoreductase [Planctomycetota bacterium]|nr:molybdopterin-dependent oxidoreductase [Planctomycetota bacterium]